MVCLSKYPPVIRKRSFEGHGIAEAFVRISNATAVEADVLRFLGKLFNFLEHLLARQYAEMAWVVAGTDIFPHGETPS